MIAIKISTWFILSIIASACMAVVFLWLNGYANYIENQYYHSEGINIAYVIALPILPAFLGAKLANDWGPSTLKRKMEWFTLVNVITNTILFLTIQSLYTFDLVISLYLIMVWICTFVVFQVEKEERSRA
ncbi:hypothetical protein [Sulfurimonas sp. HSL3-7]|uniref:hypothetical protein n=1 Tax=Sulfonitrofixus jiaomeiensis TaxID=3131938 RepID=UPI0031F7FD05